MRRVTAKSTPRERRYYSTALEVRGLEANAPYRRGQVIRDTPQVRPQVDAKDSCGIDIALLGYM